MVMYVFDNSNLSQEIFVIDTWRAVKCSLGHGRKHMLTILLTIWRPGFSHVLSRRFLGMTKMHLLRIRNLPEVSSIGQVDVLRLLEASGKLFRWFFGARVCWDVFSDTL